MDCACGSFENQSSEAFNLIKLKYVRIDRILLELIAIFREWCSGYFESKQIMNTFIWNLMCW